MPWYAKYRVSMCNDAALCALFSCLVGLWVLWAALTKLLNIIVKSLLLLSHIVERPSMVFSVCLCFGHKSKVYTVWRMLTRGLRCLSQGSLGRYRTV